MKLQGPESNRMKGDQLMKVLIALSEVMSLLRAILTKVEMGTEATSSKLIETVSTNISVKSNPGSISGQEFVFRSERAHVEAYSKCLLRKGFER